MTTAAKDETTSVEVRPTIGAPLFRPGLRDLVTFVLGGAIFLVFFHGPPLREVGGIDLTFGLTGPNSADPWKWLGAVLLVALVLGGERRRLASLLLVRPSGKDVEWVLYAFGAVMACSWLAQQIAPQEGNSGVEVITAMGVPGVLLLIVTAAVTEEVAYRGYLQERLGALLRNRWLGALASFAVFVVPHLAFFGPSWLLHQLPGAIALALVALLRRNLVAAMLLHLLINAPILIPTIAAGA